MPAIVASKVALLLCTLATAVDGVAVRGPSVGDLQAIIGKLDTCQSVIDLCGNGTYWNGAMCKAPVTVAQEAAIDCWSIGRALTDPTGQSFTAPANGTLETLEMVLKSPLPQDMDLFIFKGEGFTGNPLHNQRIYIPTPLPNRSYDFNVDIEPLRLDIESRFWVDDRITTGYMRVEYQINGAVNLVADHVYTIALRATSGSFCGIERNVYMGGSSYEIARQPGFDAAFRVTMFENLLAASI